MAPDHFAVGVVSGIPMAFEFGTNWSAFSEFTGQFFVIGIGMLLPVMLGYNLYQYHVFRGKVPA